MFTYEFVVAVALTAAPCPSVAADELRAWQGPLEASLARFALAAEIMDPRELGKMLNDVDGFPADLRLLQGRYEALAFAPHVDECQRFPDRNVAADFIAFNRAYRCDLASRLALDPLRAEELRHAIAETEHLYQIWDAIHDARCGFYYVTVRRQALQLLRELAGAEAFYSGQLPPHVPVWRFTRQ